MALINIFISTFNHTTMSNVKCVAHGDKHIELSPNCEALLSSTESNIIFQLIDLIL